MGKRITPMDLVRIEQRARREELIRDGIRPVPKNQVHRSKKAWRRRPKHQQEDE